MRAVLPDRLQGPQNGLPLPPLRRPGPRLLQARPLRRVPPGQLPPRGDSSPMAGASLSASSFRPEGEEEGERGEGPPRRFPTRAGCRSRSSHQARRVPLFSAGSLAFSCSGAETIPAAPPHIGRPEQMDDFSPRRGVSLSERSEAFLSRQRLLLPVKRDVSSSSKAASPPPCEARRLLLF